MNKNKNKTGAGNFKFRFSSNFNLSKTKIENFAGIFGQIKFENSAELRGCENKYENDGKRTIQIFAGIFRTIYNLFWVYYSNFNGTAGRNTMARKRDFSQYEGGTENKLDAGGQCTCGDESRPVYNLFRIYSTPNAEIIYSETFDSTKGYPGEGPEFGEEEKEWLGDPMNLGSCSEYFTKIAFMNAGGIARNGLAMPGTLTTMEKLKVTVLGLGDTQQRDCK